MPDKSIWTRISNPRETYTDGYGTQREVSEPGYVTIGRKIYNASDKFLNGSEEFNGVPINKGAGALEFFFDPGTVGKIDDIAKLSKHLDKFKMDELRRFKLRRKINQRPETTKRIVRNAEKLYPVNYKTTVDPVYGPYKHPASEIDYINESLVGDYIFDRTKGTDDRLMDILWRRGDLDGVKHPKIDYVYEDLPF